MTREQIDQANAVILRKWARTLADRDGDPPRGLLEELAGVTVGHAYDLVAAHKRTIRATVNPAPAITKGSANA